MKTPPKQTFKSSEEIFDTFMPGRFPTSSHAVGPLGPQLSPQQQAVAEKVLGDFRNALAKIASAAPQLKRQRRKR